MGKFADIDRSEAGQNACLDGVRHAGGIKGVIEASESAVIGAVYAVACALYLKVACTVYKEEIEMKTPFMVDPEAHTVFDGRKVTVWVRPLSASSSSVEVQVEPLDGFDRLAIHLLPTLFLDLTESWLATSRRFPPYYAELTDSEVDVCSRCAGTGITARHKRCDCNGGWADKGDVTAFGPLRQE